MATSHRGISTWDGTTVDDGFTGGQPAMHASEGVSALGSVSPHRIGPSDIDQAWMTNTNIDPGSGIPEAGQTPFHINTAGTKLSMYLRKMGAVRAMRDLGLKHAADAMGVTSNVSVPTTAPLKPAKVSGPLDPRTDKPAGQNLTNGVQTMSYGADVNDSYGSFGRRLQGNPV